MKRKLAPYYISPLELDIQNPHFYLLCGNLFFLHPIQKKRVLLKNGLRMWHKRTYPRREDLYTTLLDSSWTCCVLMFTTSFYGSWIIFGRINYHICFMHGYFIKENLQSSISNSSDKWIPCILEADGFAAHFLFSLENQHTIGYGTRQTTTECPDAMFVMSVQVITHLPIIFNW